jgi:hypothetical protein
MAEPAFESHGSRLEDTCFTRGAYRRMLEAALGSDYAFVPYVQTEPLETERACILRHDVDVDPGAALELARIEHELGVRSTYFVMTRSPIYNAFGRANQTLLREIADLGHWIGLHYDVAFRPDGSPVDGWIKAEAEVLATMLCTTVKTVSFHQPMLSDEHPSRIRVDGLVSAFDFPGFVYVSDANKVLREGSLVRMFRESSIPRLHLCIHAEWWVTDDPHLSPGELWDEALLRNLHRSQEQILATERGFGSPRTFSIGFGE